MRRALGQLVYAHPSSSKHEPMIKCTGHLICNDSHWVMNDAMLNAVENDRLLPLQKQETNHWQLRYMQIVWDYKQTTKVGYYF